MAEISISIIIPTYNRREQLKNCLSAIARQDYPREEFEVIVVDDGSRELLDDVVAQFSDRFSVQLLRQKNAGPGIARNTGAAVARGKFLAFTDDDCAPATDWLQKLVARLRQSPDCLVGGTTINGLPENSCSEASQLLADYLYNYFHHAGKSPETSFFTSNNFALSAKRFHEIGGFQPPIPSAAAEDREICNRWMQHGYKLAFASEARIIHLHALSPGKFWRQHFTYGRGAFVFHHRRAAKGNRLIRVEPPAFYLNMLRFPFSRFTGIKAVKLTFLLIASQVANAAGFFFEKLKYYWR